MLGVPVARACILRRGSDFSPLSLSPALWLDASAGPLWQDSARTTAATANGDPVGAWDDLSGNGWHVVQTTGASRPTLSLAAQNGRNVVSFDGVDDALAPASPITLGKGTLFLVGKKTLSTSWLIPLGGFFLAIMTPSDGSYYWVGSGGTNGPNLYAGTTNWQLGTWRLNTGEFLSRQNQVSGTDVTGITTSNTDYVSVGSRTGSAAFTNGHFGELLVYSYALTDAQIAQVETYLNQKWTIF